MAARSFSILQAAALVLAATASDVAIPIAGPTATTTVANTTTTANATFALNQTISITPPSPRVKAYTCSNQQGDVTSTVTSDGLTLVWKLEGDRLHINATFAPNGTAPQWAGVAFQGNQSVMAEAFVGDAATGLAAEYSVSGASLLKANQSLVKNGTLAATGGNMVLSVVRTLSSSDRSLKKSGPIKITYAAGASEADVVSGLVKTNATIDVELDRCTKYRAPVGLVGYPGLPKVLEHVCTVVDGNDVTRVSTKKPVTMTWHVKNGHLHFNATYRGVFSGWFAVGFTTAGGQMFPATALIGNMTTGTVEEYRLEGMLPSQVIYKEDQSMVVSGLAKVSNGSTTVTFVRKLSTNGTDFINGTGLAYLIWAGGNSTDLYQGHAPDVGRGDFTTHMSLCSSTRPAVQLTKYPGMPKVLHHTCSKANGTVRTAISIAKGVALTWEVTNGTLTMTATLNRTAVGWFAVGFSNATDQMVPATAFIGNVSSGAVTEFDLAAPSFAVTPKANQTLLRSGRVALVGNSTTLEFTRTIVPGANDYISASGPTYLIFASGISTDLKAGHAPGMGRGDFVTRLDLCAQVL